ncbi:Fic family protein [Desulfobacula sp.]|uniref:Fic family protein n=1 Tax=Desulfobacula sp. TaxID=2593537 RepID=UPI002622AD34|nr:Fic family protein [Desulfobacula sp.]
MNSKKWNWQQDDWPNFNYDKKKIDPLEREYIQEAGISFGIMKLLPESDQKQLAVELISDEALNTSEIEGEIFNRDSLQSSIMREFGLAEIVRETRTTPGERGIAKMMKELYAEYQHSLSHEMLFSWHGNLMLGNPKSKAGKYRTYKEDMQIVSGRIDKPKVHFVAPPSAGIPQEMNQFIDWFNQTAPGGKTPLSPLARAGIAHFHFVTIHPFEDGNGRIGRALVTKVLSQSMKNPVLTAVSCRINQDKKQYYKTLNAQNKSNEITPYLTYFSKTILESQQAMVEKLNLLIVKTKFFDAHTGNINDRQKKLILRIFREGPKGFDGSLSAKNYIAITKASKATATRDLTDLVKTGVLIKTGKLKSTRYELNLAPFNCAFNIANYNTTKSDKID